MRKSRFSEEQIISILKRVEAGQPVAEVCREVGVSDGTFYGKAVVKRKGASVG
jgi:putative transposase